MYSGSPSGYNGIMNETSIKATIRALDDKALIDGLLHGPFTAGLYGTELEARGWSKADVLAKVL